MYIYYSSDSESNTSTFPGSMHLTRRLLPSPLPHPNLFIEMFLQCVRVNGSIVLLVKYNLSTIDVMPQGSTKRSLTEETLSTMLVNFILKMQFVCMLV